MPLCTFSFPFQGLPTDLVPKATQAIEDAGGQLAGDESAGRFGVPTPFGEVEGVYTVVGQAFTVDITNKPLLIGCEAIEKTITYLLELLSQTASVPAFPPEFPVPPQGINPWEQRAYDPEQKVRPWVDAMEKGDLEQLTADILNAVPQEQRAGASDEVLKGLVNKEISYAVGNQLQQEVRAASEAQVARMFGKEPPKPPEKVGERLEKARQGIEEITGAADEDGTTHVDKILASSATLLRKKYEALLAVKFTSSQAMQILLAELAKPKR